jgi:membrane AbrB-like protein
MIPRKVGDRVKTDRRDAEMLARLWRAGELTAIWTPDEEHEAMRDLIRTRKQAMSALKVAKQQLLSFLLRHGLRFDRPTRWTKIHWRWGGMNRSTALFAAMPGGLSIASILAEDYKTEVNRVVLCHTARLVVLLVSAPIVVQLISGIDLADANSAAYADPEAIDPLNHGLLAITAVASWFLARRLNFPSGMLLLPLLITAVLHATGVVTVHVPLILSTLAQIVIGSGVGARFASYTVLQIVRDGWLAAVVGVVLAIGSLTGAILVAPLTGGDTSALFLAYLPGGAPELGVVALALKIDPAMVAAHHVLRVFLIIAFLPVLARWTAKPDTRMH